MAITTELTPELNLVVANDDLDTADYLTLPAGLAGSLRILDGLFAAGTGHAHGGAHQGAPINPTSFADGSIPGVKLADGAVTTPKLADGAVTSPKLAANLLEALFASTWTNQSANYTVAVASNIMWVFCTAAITVTLTAAINRPITIWAVTGNTTVTTTAGTVIGGSLDMTTGNVINGRVNQNDAITFKWDGANWRAT